MLYFLLVLMIGKGEVVAFSLDLRFVDRLGWSYAALLGHLMFGTRKGEGSVV